MDRRLREGGRTGFAKLLVFDVLLGNKDRHSQNLLFRELDSAPWELVLIDHGHILANGAWANKWNDLATPMSNPNLEIQAFIRKDNTKLAEIFAVIEKEDKKLLRRTAERIASADDQSILDAVMKVPNEFATEDQLDGIGQIIVSRKQKIVEIFN